MIKRNWSYTIPKDYIIQIKIYTSKKKVETYQTPITYKSYLLYKSLIDFINKGTIAIKDLLKTELIVIFGYFVLESFKNIYLSSFNDEDTIINIFFTATYIKEISHPGKTLWSGRYTAVKALIITKINGKYSILVNKRGKGCPDFVGDWNLPSGFLERGENAAQGICREVYEECSYKFPTDIFKLFQINTDPKNSNAGNVTITLIAFIPDVSKYYVVDLDRGGEKEEVDKVSFVYSTDNKQWAFHDKNIIDSVLNKLESEEHDYNNNFIDDIMNQRNTLLI